MLLRAPIKIVGLTDVKLTVRILQNVHEECVHSSNLAPGVGFEPTTNRLTADRSTTELPWIFLLLSVNLVRAIHSGQVLPTAFLKNQSKHENKISSAGESVSNPCNGEDHAESPHI